LLWIAGILLAVTVLPLALLASVVAGHLGVSRDVRVLRKSLMESAGCDWDRRIELNVGAMTLDLAGAVLAFVDLDPDARAALRAVRGADVGVYTLRNHARNLDRGAMLLAADAAMASHGWDRLVGVSDHDQLVAVYLPARIHSPRDVKVCIAVLEDNQLVVASARSNVEPLIELAFRRVDWRRAVQSPVRL
jgi:hypothetical protein